MVEINELYAEKIRSYVAGNIERVLTIPDSIKGLDPRFKILYGKLQNEDYRNLLVNFIVKHIMKFNSIYDKENLDFEKRVKHYMDNVYIVYSEHQIALLAVSYDAKLSVLNEQETHRR